MYLNIGIPKTINFPFGTNRKAMVLGVQQIETCVTNVKLLLVGLGQMEN